MTKRKLKPPSWVTLGFLALTAERADGRVLAVVVSPTDLVVMGFEVHNLPKRGVGGVEAANAVFGSHAHKVIGQAVSMAEVVALANHYVGAWLESDAAAAALCNCGEIAT